MTNAKDRALNTAWAKINALGGEGSECGYYGTGYTHAIEEAIKIIEDLGGRDPLLDAKDREPDKSPDCDHKPGCPHWPGKDRWPIHAADEHFKREPAKAPDLLRWRGAFRKSDDDGLDELDAAPVAQPAERTVENIARECVWVDARNNTRHHSRPPDTIESLFITALRAARERTKAAERTVENIADRCILNSDGEPKTVWESREATIAALRAARERTKAAEEERDDWRKLYYETIGFVATLERRCAELEAALKQIRDDDTERAKNAPAYGYYGRLANEAISSGTPHLDKLLADARREERERSADICKREARACLSDIVEGDDAGAKLAHARAGALLTAEQDIRSLPLSPQEG